MSLELQDSSFQNGVTKWHHEQCTAYMDTVDHLQKQFTDGKLEFVNLLTSHGKEETQEVLPHTILGKSGNFGSDNICKLDETRQVP